MKIPFPVFLALCLAWGALGEESKSTTKEAQDSKVETTSTSPIVKRLTVTPSPGIEYVSVSTEGLPDVSPSQQLVYSTTASPALKISDVLSGAGGQSYPTAIANHLYSPLPLYQPKYPGYQVSQPVPSRLAYSEHINSVPQQSFLPTQKLLPQQGPTPQPFYYQQPIFQPQYLNFGPQLPAPQPNYVQQQPQLFQLRQIPQPQINVPQPPTFQPQYRQPQVPQQLFLQPSVAPSQPGLPQQQFAQYPQFIQEPQFYQQAVPTIQYFHPNQQPNYQQTNYQQPNYQPTNYQQPNYQQSNYQQPNYQQPNYQPLALQIFGRGQHQGYPQFFLPYNPSSQTQAQPNQQVPSPQPPKRVYQQQPQSGLVFQPQAQPTPQPYQVFQYQPSQQLPQQPIYSQQPLSATPQPQIYQVQSQPGIVYAQPAEASTHTPVEPSRVDPDNVTDKPLKVSLQVLNPEENKNQGAYSYASFSQSLPRGFAKTESAVTPTASALAANQIQTALKIQSTLEPSSAQKEPSQFYNQSPVPNQQAYVQNQGYPNQGTQNQGYPNQGTQNQGYPTQGSQNQGLLNQGSQNQGFFNQGSQNQGFLNQGFQNQGSQNQGYSQNQGLDNQEYHNQRYQNNGQNLSQRQTQQQQFNGYPKVQFFGGLAPKIFSHYSKQ